MQIKKGTKFGKIIFSAKLPHEQQEQKVEDLISQGYNINLVQFTKGTVSPEGVPAAG